MICDLFMYVWVDSLCFKQKNKAVIIIKLSSLPALSNLQKGLTV